MRCRSKVDGRRYLVEWIAPLVAGTIAGCLAAVFNPLEGVLGNLYNYMAIDGYDYPGIIPALGNHYDVNLAWLILQTCLSMVASMPCAMLALILRNRVAPFWLVCSLRCEQCAVRLSGSNAGPCPECGAVTVIEHKYSFGLRGVTLNARDFLHRTLSRGRSRATPRFDILRRWLLPIATVVLVAGILDNLNVYLWVLALPGAEIDLFGDARAPSLSLKTAVATPLFYLSCAALALGIHSLLRPTLRAQVPVCANCGYSLRGLPTPACPACGFAGFFGEPPKREQSKGTLLNRS